MIYLSKYKTAASRETTVIEDNHFVQRVHWFSDTYDRVKTGMVYPPHVLASKVLTPDILDYVKNNPVKGKTGFILAAGSQGWAGIRAKNDNQEKGMLYYSYKVPLITLTNIYAGRVASMFGVEDFVSTDASACASSIKVLMEAQNLMHNFGFDRMIILGVEDAVNNSTLEFFGHAKASLLFKDEETMKPSAFDSVHSGFHVGQGAAVAILEKEPACEPAAKFLGAYTSAENCTNPLGQRPDGQGYRKAIEGAMDVAKIKPEEIKIVKTHGTGTPVNNQAEKTAITTVLKDFKATSYKQHIGHTLAASGLLETGLLIDDLTKGILPGIKNRTEEDQQFISEDTPIEGGTFLSLAAGMGNIYSAALFSTEV